MIEDRAKKAIEPLLKEAGFHLLMASQIIHDTGDIEDEELDNISSFISGATKKLEHYLGKL